MAIIKLLSLLSVADKAALGLLLAAALPILLAISNALTGLLATFFPSPTNTFKEIPQLLLLHQILSLTYFSYT